MTNGDVNSLATTTRYFARINSSSFDTGPPVVVTSKLNDSSPLPEVNCTGAFVKLYPGEAVGCAKRSTTSLLYVRVNVTRCTSAVSGSTVVAKETGTSNDLSISSVKGCPPAFAAVR